MPNRSGRRWELGASPGRGCHRAASTLRSASSRGSAAITVHSSGPRSAPVSARRRAFRSPPTAFSSRTMSRRRPARAPLGELAEALERLGRVLLRQRRGGGSRIAAAYSRASSRSRAPRSAGRAAAARRHGRRAPRPRAPRSRRSRAAGSAARRGGRRARARRAPRGTRARPRPGCRARAAMRPSRPRPASRASCRPRRGSARGGRTPAASRRAPRDSRGAAPRSGRWSASRGRRA